MPCPGVDGLRCRDVFPFCGKRLSSLPLSSHCLDYFFSEIARRRVQLAAPGPAGNRRDGRTTAATALRNLRGSCSQPGLRPLRQMSSSKNIYVTIHNSSNTTLMKKQWKWIYGWGHHDLRSCFKGVAVLGRLRALLKGLALPASLDTSTQLVFVCSNFVLQLLLKRTLSQ